MRIAEIYESIQGEGLLTETPSVFVRASGCNLRCWYCDTPYASWQPEGDDVSVAEIVAQVEQHDAKHVVITGGEPMLFAELVPLCDELRERSRHITIETAGTLYLPLACDLMSISPKMSNSAPSPSEYPKWHERHERTRHQPQVMRRLLAEYDYQLKFVISTPQDCEEVVEYIANLDRLDRSRLLLMPEGQTVEALAKLDEWLPDYCDKYDFVYCPRKQIEWFGVARGT
jgi:7-carboxy-7-deazaguanine synthase